MGDISRCRSKAQVKKMAKGGYVKAARPKAKKMAAGGSVQAKSVAAGGMPIPLPAGPVAGPPGPMAAPPMARPAGIGQTPRMMKQFRKGGKVKGGC
jgi:hypothetical protein